MYKKITRNKPWILFVAGLIVHLLIMPLVYHGDMTNYHGWGKYILDHGPSTIYTFSFRGQLLSNANYPPLMLWMCAFVSILTNLLKSLSWQLNLLIPAFPSKLVFFFEGELPYIYIFKLILIAANIGIAIFIYKFVRDQVPKSKYAALIASSLFLFNPAVIYGSTIWGQIDVLPIFFVLVAAYLLLYKKQLVFSSICLVVALLFKQTTIIFFPLYLIGVLKHFGRKDLIKSVLIIGISLWLAYIPFVGRWTNVFSPFSVYINKVQLASDNHFTTKSAWNIWVLADGLKLVDDRRPAILGISYKVFGYAVVSISLIEILFSYWRKKDKQVRKQIRSIMYGYFLIAMVSYLFLTELHERHLIQVLPFLILLYENKRNYYFQVIYITLFIVANLFFIWHPITLDISLGFTQLIIIKLSIAVLLLIFLFHQWKYSFKISKAH